LCAKQGDQPPTYCGRQCAHPLIIATNLPTSGLVFASSDDSASPSDPSNDCCSRFRLSVHATDRSPVARTVGVLRDSALPHVGG
jgi:hypothetical protein